MNDTKIEATELTAPRAWASYLIYDDPSGLSDEEQAECDAWIQSVGCGSPVDCVEADFIPYHDARQFAPYAADCATYTFIKR